MLRPTLLAPALATLLATLPALVASQGSNVTEAAQFFPQYNSQRVKLSYGPFTVQSMDINNGMGDFQAVGIQVPCTDCIITWMQAGLEYTNGTVANANTNLWLHHTVLANMNRTSAVCPGPGSPDLFFASGNERTAMDISVSGTEQAGYYIAPGDTWVVEVELMNMLPTNQTGVLTMTYEYIQSPPSSFSHVTALWFDIGGCNGNSDQPVISTTQPFNYTSPPWVSDMSGKITFIGGHLHDGGTTLSVYRNQTDDCNLNATYGANSAYIGGGMAMQSGSGGMSMASSMTMARRDTSMAMSMSMAMPTTSSMDMGSSSMNMASMTTSASPSSSTDMASTMSMSGSAMPTPTLIDNIHISNISTCLGPQDGVVSPGDVWTITAFYDPARHDLMLNINGSAADIMGIAIIYVANLNVTVTAAPNTTSASGSLSASVTSKSGAGSLAAMGSVGMMCLGLGWMVLMGTVV
ncbi:hypothetical protein LTR74_011689 [Friedmanniomyces endolithicus]|nr:hypothetical protein LTR74_011689 [Friedmanniomyces endolithicus]